MSDLGSPSSQRPPPAIEAEAAAWLARLHGPNRTASVDRGLRRWLELSPEHGRAFEIATDTWDKLTQLQRRPLERVARWERNGLQLSFSRAALATATVIALTALATTYYFSRANSLETTVGEQRTMTLDDGTRVALNTATHLHVKYDKQMRRIELQSGEALFQVAQHAGWPFVVSAGQQQIRALGTSFVVRRDEGGLAVILMDGKVSVTPTNNVDEVSSSTSGRLMAPGQRLTFRRHGLPQLDTPALEKVIAWQRGQVAFDNTPLADALAEMNRYSRMQLAVENPVAAGMRISGVFRTTESAEFARAIAQTYSLRVTEEPGKILLTGLPQVPSARGAPNRP